MIYIYTQYITMQIHPDVIQIFGKQRVWSLNMSGLWKRNYKDVMIGNRNHSG